MKKYFLFFIYWIGVGLLKVLLFLMPGNKMFQSLYAGRVYGTAITAMKEKDYDKAKKVLEKVVYFDCVSPFLGGCQFFYGQLLYHGLNVEKDVELAETFFQKCIDNNGSSSSEAENFIKRIHALKIKSLNQRGQTRLISIS